jgi:hypothetical protein
VFLTGWKGVLILPVPEAGVWNIGAVDEPIRTGREVICFPRNIVIGRVVDLQTLVLKLIPDERGTL